MQIQAASQRADTPAQTIRYYESIGLLPKPQRLANGYRDYSEDDVERVRFVSGARRLGLSIDDIKEILALRDEGETPCRPLLNLLQEKADEVKRRIEELKGVETELRTLHKLGLSFPEEDILGKRCICHLVRGHGSKSDSGALNSAEIFPMRFNEASAHVQLVALVSPT